MKKKLASIFVILFVLTIFAIPTSITLAAKPDKFVSFTFYGGPDFTQPMISPDHMAGKSDNHFVEWVHIGWKFSWTMDGSEVFALGKYTGNWVQHGYQPPPPEPFGSHTAQNYHGVYEMTITNWGQGEEGYLIINMVKIVNPSGDKDSKLTILDGMIGDMKVQGTGTSINIIPALVYRYNLILQFKP